MTRDEILGLVQAWARAVAACDEGAIEQLVAPPLREAVMARTRGVHAAFEEVEIVATDVVVEGDAVAWRWRLAGKHVGAIGGVAPSGTRKEIEGVNFQRVRDGKVVDHWTIADLAPQRR
jgi:predicted ester cyclase